MINFEAELEAILDNDPLGLLDIRPKGSSRITADERLIASFEEINSFYREHSREPAQSRDIGERRLYSRLKGLRESPEKAAALLAYDEFGLLKDVTMPEPIEINTIDDVLEHDVLGLLGVESGSEEDIFRLKNVSKSIKMPEKIARRKPCEDFEKYEPLFKQVHADLSAKRKVMRKFEGERQIEPGEVFLTGGMLVYVASRGQWEERSFGNKNARLHCIFENGTESEMLLRSLAAALWIDKNSRHIVDANQAELALEATKITSDDSATGYVYVLRSLSNDPQIKKVANLFKIGFSTQPVAQRIQKAKEEPTYLMSDVVPVTEFRVYNVNPQKIEALIHTFFAQACLNIDVIDSKGRRHSPREWFMVPLHIIEASIKLLISGEIVNYRYDSKKEKIIEKD